MSQRKDATALVEGAKKSVHASFQVPALWRRRGTGSSDRQTIEGGVGAIAGKTRAAATIAKAKPGLSANP